MEIEPMKVKLPPLVFVLLLVIPGVLHAQPSRPNVLVVLSDDHSAAHVGAYGNTDIQTPNLDAFAKEGMRFERAYVAAPQCVPSRAALMTGRSPVALQMTRFSAPLPIEAKTWLELLRPAGWFTGVAGRAYHLDGSVLAAGVADRLRQTSPEDVRPAPGLRQGRRRAGTSIGAVPRISGSRAEGQTVRATTQLQRPTSSTRRKRDPVPHDPQKIKLPAHYPDTPAVRADFARYYDEIARFDTNFLKCWRSSASVGSPTTPS